MNDKIQYYNDLMKLTYGDAINKLLSLHGAWIWVKNPDTFMYNLSD